jgi:hypothetical protein
VYVPCVLVCALRGIQVSPHLHVGMCMHMCAYSLAYTECDAYAPCCDVICGLLLHHMFRHYFINGMIFGKKVTDHKMCVLIFSTTFIQNISHSKKNLESCHKR